MVSTKQYTDDILSNCTFETCNFINQCYPNKLIKIKRKKDNGTSQNKTHPITLLCYQVAEQHFLFLVTGDLDPEACYDH